MPAAPPLRLSVALCTFNGARYLPEQLRSLTAQSRLPDEVVAFDDGSTDPTVDLLRAFARSAPFPVHVHLNAATLGPAQNFGQAIAACSGDVIACCDQDDVWHAEKLARIAVAFERDPTLGFAFSDADMTDAEGHPLGYRLWESVGFTPALQRRVRRGETFDVLLRQNVVTGATLAFAAQLRPLVLPINGTWMHDGWIALLASAVAPCATIAEPLIAYRQHAAQSVGATRRSLWQQYRNAQQMSRHVFAEQAEACEAVLKRLDERGASPSPQRRDALGAKIEHSRARSAIRLRQQSRLLAVRELVALRYRRFGLGWKSFAQDLFL